MIEIVNSGKSMTYANVRSCTSTMSVQGLIRIRLYL